VGSRCFSGISVVWVWCNALLVTCGVFGVLRIACGFCGSFGDFGFWCFCGCVTSVFVVVLYGFVLVWCFCGCLMFGVGIMREFGFCGLLVLCLFVCFVVGFWVCVL